MLLAHPAQNKRVAPPIGLTGRQALRVGEACGYQRLAKLLKPLVTKHFIMVHAAAPLIPSRLLQLLSIGLLKRSVELRQNGRNHQRGGEKNENLHGKTLPRCGVYHGFSLRAKVIVALKWAVGSVVDQKAHTLFNPRLILMFSICS
ncbi:hypothetical protein ACFSTI_05700 [Rhizorhabdus histidinilytica]